MPAEARVMKTRTQQKGLIPIFLIGFGAWFLWDGLVGWTRSNERWDLHEQLKARGGAWEQEWRKLCSSRGWKTEPPHRRYERGDIIGQLVLAGLLGASGVFALVYWLRVKKSTLRSEADAVFTPSGRRVPYDAITEVDRRKWKSKGLATVFYKLEGSKGRFVLDDAKYEPHALDTILDDIVQKTGGKAKIQG